MRKFNTGATRDNNEDKLDFEGFLSPLVIKAYGKYIHKHRKQADGTLRASDNWQKGIPKNVYIKSAWRHFLDVWLIHRGFKGRETIEDALCGVIFNLMGYLYEYLRSKRTEEKDEKKKEKTKKKTKNTRRKKKS